jgi:hypothetical protein
MGGASGSALPAAAARIVGGAGAAAAADSPFGEFLEM